MTKIADRRADSLVTGGVQPGTQYVRVKAFEHKKQGGATSKFRWEKNKQVVPVVVAAGQGQGIKKIKGGGGKKNFQKKDLKSNEGGGAIEKASGWKEGGNTTGARRRAEKRGEIGWPRADCHEKQSKSKKRCELRRTHLQKENHKRFVGDVSQSGHGGG